MNNKSTSQSLNVLFISHEDPGFGGAPKSLIELIKNLKGYYGVHPIVVVYSKDSVYTFCKKENIDCYILSSRDTDLGPIKSFMDKLKFPIKKVRQLYSENHALRLLNEKINVNDIDLIHSNVSVVGLGSVIHKKYKIPHIMHLREAPNIINRDAFSHNNYVQYLNKSVDEFIAISNFTRTGWIENGLDKRKIDMVYNGLNLPPKKEKNILNNKVIKLVLTGSIQKSKGQKNVIEALGKLPTSYREKFTLDLFGTGSEDYTQHLKKYIKELGLRNINFKGYNKNIFDKLKKYDIGIMSSPSEAFGRTTIEYMASGLGVIGANGGATPELIDDQETGYLYNNSDELAQILINIANDRNKMLSFAEKAQEHAYQSFTSKINSMNVYKEYIKLLNKN